MRSRKILFRSDGTEETLPSKCDGVPVLAGDLLHFITWGGAGWGDPFDRDPTIVAQEVRRGLVTSQGAARYGVVLTVEGTVDTETTQTLRATLPSARGTPELFSFGGSIDELRKRCLRETGLPAPRPPPANGRRSAAT